MVNWMDGLQLLRWLMNFCNRSGPWGQTTNVSSTNRSHSDGFCSAKSRANFSKYSMKFFLTMGDREVPIAMPSLGWKNVSSTRKYVVLRQTFSSSMIASPYKTDCCAGVQSLWSLFLTTRRPSSTGAVVRSLTPQEFKASHPVHYGVQSDSTTAFLDVVVIREETTLATKVYRKPTHTGRYLNFNSNHPSRVKRGLIQSLHNRASTICQERQDLVKEISSLRSDLQLNSYAKASLTRSLIPRAAVVWIKSKASGLFVYFTHERCFRGVQTYRKLI
jgi:hypothetical protein